MKKVFQFVIEFNPAVSTVVADNLAQASIHLEESLKNDRTHKIQYAGEFSVEEFGKLFSVVKSNEKTVVEKPTVDSLEAMARMLRDNSYEVYAKGSLPKKLRTNTKSK